MECKKIELILMLISNYFMGSRINGLKNAPKSGIGI
jgi:hypothetical protein